MLRLRSHYTNSRKQKSIHTKHTAQRADIISHLQAQSMRTKSDSVSDDFRNKIIQKEMVMSELKCLSFLILFSFLLFASNLVSYLCSSLSYLILLIFLLFSLFHSCSTSFTFLFLRIVLLLQCPDRKVTQSEFGMVTVSIVSDYTLHDGATGVLSPVEKRIFPPASVSRPALRPTQPPVQWVRGDGSFPRG
jgi:hypothetical protein